MWERFWTLWWMAGAGVFIGLLWPLVIGHVFMTVRDHRRHGDWQATLLAIIWPLLCVAGIGVLQGNLAPPLFGVPILLLALAWMTSRIRFVVGVSLFYLLSGLVVTHATVTGTEIHWGFLLFWPASLAALMAWRSARMAALSEPQREEPS